MGTTQETRIGLRERARQAFLKWQREQEQQQAESRAVRRDQDLTSFRYQLMKLVNDPCEVVLTDPDDLVVIDGVTFGYRPTSDGRYLQVWGICQECDGTALIGEAPHRLVDLGELLAQGYPNAGYRGEKLICADCQTRRYEERRQARETQPAPVPEPTLPERLESLLREIVRDELQQGREDF